MALVTRTYRACIGRRVYPQTFTKGAEVTGEAEEIGREMGCVESSEAKASDGSPENKASGGGPENKAAGAPGKSAR